MPDRVSRTEMLSGVLFVALVLVTIIAFAGSAPGSDASASKVVSYFESHRAGTRASAYLTAVAIIVGLYFFSVVRTHLAQSDRARRFASLAISGLVVYAAGAAASAGVLWTMADVPSKLSPATMQGLNALESDVDTVFFGAGVGLMLIAFAVAILRSALMPAWFGWLSIVLGVVAVAVSGFGFASAAAGIWTLFVVVILYRRLPATPRSQVARVSSASQGA
jgi:hypothetical protein